jgi:hypothetical protein
VAAFDDLVPVPSSGRFDDLVPPVGSPFDDLIPSNRFDDLVPKQSFFGRIWDSVTGALDSLSKAQAEGTIGEFGSDQFSPEQSLMSPGFELPRKEIGNVIRKTTPLLIIAEKTGLIKPQTSKDVSEGIANVGAGLVESAMSPGGVAIAASTLLPGGPQLVGGIMAGLATEQASKQLGEASVTGDVKTATEGVLNATLAPLTAGAALKAGKVSEAVKFEETPGISIDPGEPITVNPVAQSTTGVFKAISNFIKGVAGESMPKTTAMDRLTGEAGVRYASSRIAAQPLARTFAAHALEGTGVDPIKFGAALTEDNLASIRAGFENQAETLLAEGNMEAAAAASEAADGVATIIGAKGSPFKTANELHEFLADPATQTALEQHKALWEETIEPQFKEAQNLDPDIVLPSRGLMTGARINLKAILEDTEGQPGKVVKGTSGASLTATFKKKSPFGVKAKGTGQAYDIDYNQIIANTFERQLERANKNVFDKKLVESGNAVIDAPGKQVMIGDEPTEAFPLTRKTIVTPDGAFSKSENIYVRKSLANEYRAASNVDKRFGSLAFKNITGFLNKVQIAGLTDFTVHISNIMTALFNRPVSGKLFTDSLLSATGRADIPVTLGRVFKKAFENNQDQLSELAEIGAMREPHKGFNLGTVISKVDTVTRLVLDDTFKSLVEEGLVKNTETARREYVNQIGQYNRRLQGQATRFFRETGVGPFVTAGKTFNALGVKMATLTPGAEASSLQAAAALRVNALTKWIGASVLVGTLNYLLTKDKGGGMMGRPGTPLGNVDFGTNDKAGKQLSLPLGNIIGLGRGLRVTGAKGAIDAKRLGLTDSSAFDAAARDIINSWAAPGIGPPVRTAVIASMGYPAAIDIGRVSGVALPGESQKLKNVKEAVLEMSPIVDSFRKWMAGKSSSEVLASQLPRFTLVPGKTTALVQNYPRIVQMAQANVFIEDMIAQGRRLPQSDKVDFIRTQIMRLPPESRKHALDEVKRRKVFAPPVEPEK